MSARRPATAQSVRAGDLAAASRNPSGFPRVDRPRVIDLLGEYAPTLVSGPPGFGKTTILQQWMRASRLRDAAAPTFLTIQRRHDDASAFVADLLAAAGSPVVLEGVLSGKRDLEGETRQVVVLDRIDILTSDASLDVLRTLLVAQVVIVAAARDPRAPASRLLRFEGRAVHVGPAALAFTDEESSRLLAEWGVSVDASDVARFIASGNGWPLGVGVLARHVAAAGRLDDDVMLNAWEEFREYLDYQVVANLDSADVHVLAQAVIEDGIVAPIDLCPQGVPDVISRVERLAAAGYFVPTDVPLERRQLHRALRGTIRWRMRSDVDFGRAMWGEAVARRLRTGRWLDALQLAMVYGDDLLLVQTLEEAWPSCYTSNAVVEAALERLPIDVRHTSASLLVLEGLIASVRDGDIARMEVAVRMASELGEPPTAAARLCVEWTSISVSLLAGRYDEAESHATRVLALLEPGAQAGEIRADVRSAALRAVAFLRLTSGDLPAARRHFEAARSAARLIDAQVFAAASSAGLALIAAMSGREKDAAGHLRDAAALGDADVHPMAASLVAAQLATCLCAVLRGDLAAAGHAVSSLQRVTGGSIVLLPFVAYVQGSVYRLGGGMLGLGTLEDTAERAGDGPFTDFQTRLLAAGRALAHLGADDADGARAIARSIPSDDLHVLCGPSIVGLAHLRAGDPEAARQAVQDCVQREAHLPRTRIHALLVAAVASWLTEQVTESTSHLERAIALAAVEDCVGDLLTLMPGSRALRDLAIAVHGATQEPVVQAVCLRMEETAMANLSDDVLPLLTPRELEIAALLPTDQQLSSIAVHLAVSINTLKTQLRSIYRKLGVKTRQDAVRLLNAAGSRDEDRAGSPVRGRRVR